MNSQGWEFAPDIAQRPASRILSTYVSGTGSGRRSRMLMRRGNSSRNCSYSGVVFSSLFAIMGSLVRRGRRLLLAPARPESDPLRQTLSGVGIKQCAGDQARPRTISGQNGTREDQMKHHPMGAGILALVAILVVAFASARAPGCGVR